MKQQTVYRYEVWNLATRTKSFAAMMGTAEAIRRARGEADLDSAILVDASEIDANGLYDANTSRSTA